MMIVAKSPLWIICFVFIVAVRCPAQNADSVKLQNDTSAKLSPGNVHKHHKNNAWGNSTVFACGFTHSTTNDLAIEVGRAYVEESGLGIVYRNIGLGYSHPFNNITDNYYRLFYEIAGVTPPIGGISMRLEAMANNSFNTYFIKPYIGLTFAPIPSLQFDIQYCHAFLLAGKENLFKNGITIRAKMLLNEKKWENIPSHRHHQ